MRLNRTSSAAILLLIVLAGAAALRQNGQLRSAREREQALMKEMTEPVSIEASSAVRAPRPEPRPGW